MRFAIPCGLFAAVLLMLPGAERAPAHEGHDDTPAAGAALPAGPRAEAKSDAFELVAVAKAGELTIYLDRLATNEPVTDAAIAVETPQGSVDATTAADGSYRAAAPWSVQAGRYELVFTVSKDGAADVLPLALEVPRPASGGHADSGWAHEIQDRLGAVGAGIAGALIATFMAGAAGGYFLARRRTAVALIAAAAVGLMVHADASAHDGHDAPQAAPSALDVSQRLPDGGVFIPKSTQRILAIRTAVAEAAVHRRTVELPGRIIPDPNASGHVQTLVGGRLSAPAGGFPRLGARVAKGQVLAYVAPPIQAIDVSDMRQRQGELDQQISIIERRLLRYESLAPTGAVARVQLEETQLELLGLKERRASLDTVRREPEALIAPVDGVIAEGTPVAGQVAQTNAIVFSIVDPARLWVEALSYEALPDPERATAQTGNATLTLAFRGAGFADRNQSIPVHFAIEDGAAGVRAGQFVTVLAETSESQQGIAVPRSAIVRNSAGQDLVYEHVSAERFEPRPVRTEPLDGQRVLLSHGLTPGKRVVVQGAELIDHIR